MSKSFHKFEPCDCGLPDCDVCTWEKRLEDEGLGHGESVDSTGSFVLLSNKGSGKLKDASAQQRRLESAEEMERRRALLDQHTFPSRDRSIYSLYASGMSMREIALRFRHPNRHRIRRVIQRVERDYAAARMGEAPTPVRVRHHVPTPGQQLAAIVRECDPATIVCFFALIERALKDPDTVRGLLVEAHAIPELRDLLDPEPQNDTHLEDEDDDEHGNS